MHQSNGPSNKTEVLFGLCFSVSGEGKSVLLSLIRPLVSQRSLNIWSRIRPAFESFGHGASLSCSNAQDPICLELQVRSNG